MKMKIFIVLICLVTCASSIFAQIKESIKVNELYGYITCGDFRANLDNTLFEYLKSTESKIYIVFYEGKHEILTEGKNKMEIRWVNPRVGDAFSRAKDSSLYLRKMREVPAKDIVIVNGGYKEKFSVENWVVPKNAEPPKLTPTLKKRDLKFRSGKPFSSRNYTNCYS